LSWLIREGTADGVDLAALPVAIASRSSDDDPGSPWTWILYLDERADDRQRAALEDIFTGPSRRRCDQSFPVGVESK